MSKDQMTGSEIVLKALAEQGVDLELGGDGGGGSAA